MVESDKPIKWVHCGYRECRALKTTWHMQTKMNDEYFCDDECRDKEFKARYDDELYKPSRTGGLG